MLVTLAIDIGGSHIKMLRLNEQGKALGEKSKKSTPRPATPNAIYTCIKSMISKEKRFDRISIGFPGVVRKGVIKTAPNLDGDWADFELEKEVSKLSGKPVRVANDADIQGYGTIVGKDLEMIITLGTGMGAAIFINGQLVPNLELGHHPLKGKKTYEDFLGQKALDKYGKKKWNFHLMEAISMMRKIFNFDRLYIGGGNAEKINFTPGPDVVLSHNIAGLTGGLKLWKK